LQDAALHGYRAVGCCGFTSPPAAGKAGFARNIFKMRSVMRKPPTTLTVEATTAKKPSAVLTLSYPAPATTSEPTSEMPEMALVADISGVWRSGETREITW